MNESPSSRPLRTIKTFVLRTGRMTESQRRAYDALWPQWGLDYEPELLDFATLYGNDHPVIFEIGYGMGHSLSAMGQGNPEINYLGTEVHTPGVGRLLNEIDAHGLTNIRTYSHDALEILKHCIPDNSLQGLLLFFPDPWHKKKHHKRRMVQEPFAELVYQKLQPGGFLHMATDWQHYAEQMMQVLTAAKGFENTSGPENYSPRPDYRTLTKFERRGHRLGHGVWDLIFRKTE